MRHRGNYRKAAKLGLRATAIMAALVGATGMAQAMIIDTGNPDITMIWGNTIRYNTGWRMDKRNDVIGNTANNDEGDYAFDRGDRVTNRWDLLTEFDFNYDRQMGFRISAAVWKESAYDGQVHTNPIFAARSSYIGDQYSSYTKRFIMGPSGEFLDAYVFGNFQLGDMPANVKIGRQTTLWGEVLSLSTHSVSYAQAPTDGYKGLANPGIDARESALPVGQISGTLQVLPNLALLGQYYFEWQPTRLAQGGTYLASTDFILQGPDRNSVAPGRFLVNRGLVKPKNSGEWGIGARWRPEWLDGNGTLGVYYREFSERNPSLNVFAGGGYYRALYAEDIKLYGVSFSKKLGGLSVGAELVHRENTALNGTVTDGSSDIPRGDTTHALLNGVLSLWPTSLWDAGSLTAEVAYSRWNKVTANEKFFNTCDHRPANDRDEATGCVTKDAWQGTMTFSPQWVAVWPGWDLAGRVSYGRGLKGNGAVPGGGNYKAGSYSVGMTFTYNQKHDFTIAYNDYLATNQPNAAGAIRVSNGGQLQDRGWLVLTYKGSF